MNRFAPFLTVCFFWAQTAVAAPDSCNLSFTVEITQGVGMIRPGTEMQGSAAFTLDGRSFRQEGNAMAHMAQGEMRLGNEIAGPIWTLITSQSGVMFDKVSIFARDVTGLTVAGVAFEGPMALTLFGDRGTRSTRDLPTTQEGWAEMDLRRAFFLQTGGWDMLAGDVTALSAECS